MSKWVEGLSEVLFVLARKNLKQDGEQEIGSLDTAASPGTIGVECRLRGCFEKREGPRFLRSCNLFKRGGEAELESLQLATPEGTVCLESRLASCLV